jgi:hypothetical protein
MRIRNPAGPISFFASIYLEHEGVLVGQAVVAVGGMVGRLDRVGGWEGGDQAGHLFPHAAVQFCIERRALIRTKRQRKKSLRVKSD